MLPIEHLTSSTCRPFHSFSKANSSKRNIIQLLFFPTYCGRALQNVAKELTELLEGCETSTLEQEHSV